MFHGSCYSWLLYPYLILVLLDIWVVWWLLCFLDFVDLGTYFCFCCQNMTGWISLKFSIFLVLIELTRCLLIIKLLWIRKSLGLSGWLELECFWESALEVLGGRGRWMVMGWVWLIMSRRSRVSSLWEGCKCRGGWAEMELVREVR